MPTQEERERIERRELPDGTHEVFIGALPNDENLLPALQKLQEKLHELRQAERTEAAQGFLRLVDAATFFKKGDIIYVNRTQLENLLRESVK